MKENEAPLEPLGNSKLRDLGDVQEHEFTGLKRERWWQIWRPRHRPPPPPARLEDAEIIPLANASFISKLTFQWITPIMVKGYQRPLQATDLWKMDESRESMRLSEEFLRHLRNRQGKAQEHNKRRAKEVPSKSRKMWWGVRTVGGRSIKESEEKWREERYGSVAWALNDTLSGFWSGGVYKVIGDTAALVAPLVVKALIRFSQEVAAAEQAGTDRPGIGRGIGMAFGLWALTVFASVCTHQFFFRSMSTGAMARGTLITALYQQGVRLSTAARLDHPNGRLVNNISSDISRIDFCAQWFHAVWTAPIQLAVCLLLLILQLGPAALVGFSLFILLGPVQTWFMKLSFIMRKKSMRWTDARAQLLRELLSSMQIIKLFVYEVPFLKRLRSIRRNEMLGIRKILIIRAANQAMAFSVPTLAAVLSFVVYARTHDDLDPALIFTSLALFNLLRQPLMFLPRALSSVTDAQNALERVRQVFEAETTDIALPIDRDLSPAIRINKATFQWTAGGKGERKSTTTSDSSFGDAFRLEVDLEIERGKLVAVVGSVGSGKSSLLQGIIGEMPRIQGSVTVGGKVAYCQQQAWIQNATVRENILFGQTMDSNRYWQVIKDASLLADLELLPDGDLTEIGEKGVNLSGGQKQRINIARALYNEADIILLDDPFSAVDAHVGEALFHNAVLSLKRRGATVVLVTHALHFLQDVDEICLLHQGQVTDQGSHAHLIANSSYYARLFADFGGKRSESKPARKHDIDKDQVIGKAEGSGKLEGRLMVSEKRKTGSLGGKVYAGYLRAGRATWTLPLAILFAVIMQGAQVMSTVWLTYWEANSFSQSPSFYEGMYAALGIGQAVFTFAMGAVMGILSYFASNNLHADALKHAFYAPMSVFDTQPLGRMLGVFGKDVDVADNQLADSLRMLAMTLSALIGSVIIVTVYLHPFIAIIVVVGVGYWYFSLYYRTSARELKRLDALLRGLLYSHFSESLSGLATIRAYNEHDRFIRENAYYMDLENRAYLLTSVNQRWLAVRLDFLGGILVFAVAIMAAEGGAGISPSEIALCLTYMVTIVQIFGMTAEVENNMNSVERILWYSTNLAQEPDHFSPAPAGWPAQGGIEFKDVTMAYRPGLPTVLNKISLSIRSGERIGIVGRTGAGKSSITVALFRLCELIGGSINIDGMDISTLGLDALRGKVAIIPQDPVLFSGTLRSNLDPFENRSDAHLHDAIKRSHLGGRFTLDTAIADEGSNLSVGERSLVSLARALVKDAKIVVLDEATAAVDLETDAKIQQTIMDEFTDKTLLCIAHRLRTIIGWDRILVMEAGQVKEFATPAELFEMGGVFHGMCVASGVTLEDIQKARKSEAPMQVPP